MSVDKQQSSVTAKAQEQAILSRLQQVPVFARLPSKYIQVMRKVAKPMQLTADEVLCSEGDAPAGLFILIKGALELRRGEEEIARLEPVSSAGEVSVLTGDPHAEDVVCVEEGVALHIPFEFLSAALKKEVDLFQRMSRNAINALAEQLTVANDAQSEIASEHADVMRAIGEVEVELNDARMIASMRGDE